MPRFWINRDHLDAAFLDQAPAGLGSALSFFSDEAFGFYLPAYLIADIRTPLRTVDPTLHLCHGLDSVSEAERVNPRRYGERTWGDVARFKWAMFTAEQLRAIRLYLEYKEANDFVAKYVKDAMERFWLPLTTGE